MGHGEARDGAKWGVTKESERPLQRENVDRRMRWENGRSPAYHGREGKRHVIGEV